MMLHNTNPNQCPYLVSPPTPYRVRYIARTRFYRSRSLRLGERSNQGHIMTLHTYIPQPMLGWGQCTLQAAWCTLPKYTKF